MMVRLTICAVVALLLTPAVALADHYRAVEFPCKIAPPPEPPAVVEPCEEILPVVEPDTECSFSDSWYLGLGGFYLPLEYQADSSMHHDILPTVNAGANFDNFALEAFYSFDNGIPAWGGSANYMLTRGKVGDGCGWIGPGWTYVDLNNSKTELKSFSRPNLGLGCQWDRMYATLRFHFLNDDLGVQASLMYDLSGKDSESDRETRPLAKSLTTRKLLPAFMHDW